MSSNGFVPGPGSDLVLVGNLQEQLNDLGFDCGPPDNVYGERTVEAVKRFQESAGLPVTGLMDGATWRKIFNTDCIPDDLLNPEAAVEAAVAPYTIGINLAARRLTFFEGRSSRGTYPVAVGKPATPTPTGDFVIVNKRLNPGGVFGSRWMGFTTRGHGIHGTNAPQFIGQAVSLGCVRMHNHHIEAIYPLVPIGTPVVIRISEAGPVTPAPANPGTAPSPGGGGTAPPVGGKRTYVVQPGDSLWSIARRFGTTVEAIQRANGLATTVIHPGQRLVIP
ncbi:MAG: L,D-transpeptidase family protein [Thermoanaerobacterales bacterium]|nr:L,D-transpeptidase family protein [Thermoanaerobacterales bacterium]